MKRSIFVLSVVLSFSNLGFAAAGELIPRKGDDCEKTVRNTAMVIVGEMPDGTPILKPISLTTYNTDNLAPPESKVLRRKTQSTSLSAGRLIELADSMRSDIAPSAESMSELISTALTGSAQYQPETILVALERTNNPLAVVWLTHMLYMKDALDIVPANKWDLVIQSLDNASSEKVPDYALTGTRAAVEVLLNADLPATALAAALKELKESARYESDFGVRFIAAVAYYKHGGDRIFDTYLRDNLSDDRVPKYVADMARHFLNPRGLGHTPSASRNLPAPRERERRIEEGRSETSRGLEGPSIRRLGHRNEEDPD